MPKKLFLSSTCYDLGDVRQTIESWAKPRFQPLLSDRANFPVDPAQHRHDVCLAVAGTSDLMILLIGGRLGAPYYADKSISVTWAEFRTAAANNVRIAVFVDHRVWQERDAYRRDKITPVVTKDIRTFDFLNEIQDHPSGYWMTFYKGIDDVVTRLETLTTLVPIGLSQPRGGLRRDGKHIVVKSLSHETQHHVRLTVGDVELLSAEALLQAMLSIPREVETTECPQMALHGFSTLVSSNGSESLVRASPLGEAILEELDFAFSLV